MTMAGHACAPGRALLGLLSDAQVTALSPNTFSPCYQKLEACQQASARNQASQPLPCCTSSPAPLRKQTACPPLLSQQLAAQPHEAPAPYDNAAQRGITSSRAHQRPCSAGTITLPSAASETHARACSANEARAPTLTRSTTRSVSVHSFMRWHYGTPFSGSAPSMLCCHALHLPCQSQHHCLRSALVVVFGPMLTF